VVQNERAFVFQEEVSDDWGQKFEEDGGNVQQNRGKLFFCWCPGTGIFVWVTHI
jgi:hypothetical protein